MRNTRLALSIGLVVAAVLIGLSTSPAPGNSSHSKSTLSVRSDTRDLLPAVANPTDGIRSHVRLRVWRTASEMTLKLSGFAAANTDRWFGAHLHSGPCVAGNGAAAGPHYNSDVAAGSPSPEISPRTEVWLDFRVRRDGTAQARAAVPFTIPAGDRSVVIHELPTAPNGTAGVRMACLPVVW